MLGVHRYSELQIYRCTEFYFSSFRQTQQDLLAAMEWLFGKRVTPEEMLRKNQRALNKAMRDLDREKMRMEQQEKKIIADIKKLAKEGQMVLSVFPTELTDPIT